MLYNPKDQGESALLGIAICNSEQYAVSAVGK